MAYLIDFLKRIFNFFKDMYIAYINHQLSFMAAALTYFTFLSFFNLLFFLSGVLGFIVRNPQVRQAVLDYVVESVPLFTPFAQQNLQALATFSYPLGIIGLALLIYSAIGVFASINQALDNVYEVRPVSTVRQTLKSLLAMLLIFLTLLISSGFSYLAAFGKPVLKRIAVSVNLSQITSSVISFLFLFLTILIIYRLLVDKPVRLVHLWAGAVFATFVWKGLEFLYKLYLDKYFAPTQIFGITSFVIATLIWIYLSSLIVFFGAEVNVYVQKKWHKGKHEAGR